MSTTTHAPATRIAALDWDAMSRDMDDLGCALSTPILTPEECGQIVDMFDREELFRSTIDMARYRFGKGRYRYFAHPVPEPVASMRAAFWPHLLPIAREWADRLGQPAPWPDDFDDWLEHCHAAGQKRPTPILFTYGEGDWNALHRDLYGALYFPMQVVIGLNAPGRDHTGGEFLLLEQRPRAQSRGTSMTLGQGQALVFTTSERPVPSRRWWSKAPVRHGVSVVRSGERHTLALVLHDAE
ncbi:MAG: 2OG-Fe(II) oxygenase [Actinomycetes bacterium]